MTTLDNRPIAHAAPLHRPPRRARTAPQSTDLHARLVTEANRLLAVADATEMTAYDALGGLLGALINAFPQGGRPLSKHALVDLMERVGGGLGCPPPLSPDLDRHDQVGHLAQTLADYPSPFQAAISAARTFKETDATADFDSLWSAAEVLRDELGVGVSV